jgi:SagB-type dehydrogenase family enzyme
MPGVIMRSILDYHEGTSYDRGALGGHFLDWGNQPEVYKRYPGARRIPLPDELDLPQVSLWELVSGRGAEGPSSPTSLKDVARLLLLSYCRTGRSRHSGGEFHYRSVPSAGALYPCELYLGARNVSGLNPGLYHYAIQDYCLTSLREGDVLGHLDGMALPGPGYVPDLVLFVTAISFRSAWKYRDRAYRYHLLDSGHLVEGVCLALQALGMSFRVDYDFDDAATNAFLGLDGTREFCLAVIRAWGGAGVDKKVAVQPAPTGPSATPASTPVAPRELRHPAIEEVHRLTSKVLGGRLQDLEMPLHLGLAPGPWRPVPLAEAGRAGIASYTQALWMRRSKRNFVKRALSGEQFRDLVALLCAPGGEGTAGSSSQAGLGLGLLVGEVEGLEQGFHILDRDRALMAMVSRGSKVAQMAKACLDQEWLAHASVHILFMSNLDLLERGWGPRGYRYAMLSAGRLAQRIYLGATATGMGCCGIGAFYDKEASQLLGLNAQSRLLYLVAVGPIKK